MKEVSIIGPDLAKNVFQAHGAGTDGAVVFRRKLSRAQLVVLTDKGRKAFDNAMRLYDPAAYSISTDISIADMKIALKVMNAIRGKLEELNEDGD